MLSGDQQLGHYRLVRRIGSGGMGEVYLAEDTRIARQLAIKVIRSESNSYADPAAQQEAARLFQREMRAVTMLDHPHILPLFDFGEETIGNTKLTYMVMPLRQEGSFADWLQKRASAEKLAPHEMVHFIMQAADALQHAHDHQLIHQDVKPSNFLVRNRVNAPLPDLLLTDFGIARIASATATASQSIRGTPAFMAPEQWEGNAVPATDQYALAIMAYLLLTGITPFSGRMEQVMRQHFMVQPPPPSRHNPALPPDLDAVILRALEKQPDQRFPSIMAFAQACQDSLQARPTTMSPEKTEVAPAPGNTGDQAKNSLAPAGTEDQTKITPATNPPTLLSPTVYPNSSTPLLPPMVAAPRPGQPAINAKIVPQSFDPVTPIMAGMPHHYASAPGSTITGKTRRTRLSLIILSLLILLALLALSVPFVASNIAQNANFRQNANNNATATAVELDRRLYPSYLPGKGTFVFADTLNSASNHWDTGTNSTGGDCQFADGGYQVSQYQNSQTNIHNYMTCGRSGVYTNFVFEVQMTILTDGDCGGVAFRDDGNGHFYLFSLCSDSSYQVYKYVGNKSTDAQTIKTDYVGDAYLNGENVIDVMADGDTLTFFVNQQRICQVQDNSYTGGQIKLIADPVANSSTTTTYKNASLWTL